MFEDARVEAGEAILDGAAVAGLSEVEVSRDERVTPTLDALVREHSRMVYRIAYAALRSHPDAEDAVQETFVRVLRYGSKLDGVRDPKTWLARIAWRVAVDRFKRRPGKQEIPLEDHRETAGEVASSESSAEDSALAAQVGGTLEKLIEALPEKLRGPLMLSALEEMKPVEVAATLGVSEAAVRSRVFRARQILKEKLAQWAGSK